MVLILAQGCFVLGDFSPACSKYVANQVRYFRGSRGDPLESFSHCTSEASSSPWAPREAPQRALRTPTSSTTKPAPRQGGPTTAAVPKKSQMLICKRCVDPGGSLSLLGRGGTGWVCGAGGVQDGAIDRFLGGLGV